MARKTVTSPTSAGKPKPAANPQPTALADADLLRTIAKLLADSDLTEIEMQKGDLRIRAARQPAAPAHATFALPAYASHAPPPPPPPAPAPAPPVAPAAFIPQMPELTTAQRLQELETLRATGTISESEYTAKRQQILADL